MQSTVESIAGKMKPLDVLLIEDNAAEARLTQEMLRDEGRGLFEVTVARSMGEATLHADSCEIILLDLSLPDAEGLDTFRRALSLAVVPIVVVTGYNDEAMALRALVAGAQDYLVKGQFTSEMLVRSIRYAMERHRLDGQRRQASIALRESEERYRRFFEEDLTGDCVISGDGSIVACNPAFARMFGFDSAEEACRSSFAELLPNSAAREQLIETLIREGRAERFELSWRHRAGQAVQVVGNAVAVLDDSGRPIEFHAFLFDETERKLTQEHLRQSQKMEAIGRLAGGVAHDFNNLLTAVAFHAEFLLSSLPEGNSLRERVEDIKTASRRAASLTSQLLTFSRRGVRQPKLVDLNHVVSDVRNLFDRVIGEDIQVEDSLQDDLWKTRVDPGQLAQVILNLVINARDAMPDGGRLILKTANLKLTEPRADTLGSLAPGRFVSLSVADTGQGIAPETKSKIFEPFFTTKRQGQGTGLGLSTVYGIIQQSLGHISVESEVGAGTTFEILIPRAEGDRPADPLWDPSGVIQFGTETILVVEDDDALRQLMMEALESQGFRVVGAGSGEEALRKSDKFLASLDLLITDMVMPGIRGTDLGSQLQTRCESLQVSYSSGYNDDPSVQDAIEATATAFLAKPFSPADLTTMVREILDAPADESA